MKRLGAIILVAYLAVIAGRLIIMLPSHLANMATMTCEQDGPRRYCETD